MEPLLKPRFPQLHRLFAQKIKYRAITILLLFLLGLILVLGIQQLSVERVIGKESKTIELICSRTPNLAPEELSKNGRMSYDSGKFDDARDCWRKAVDAYRQQGNETETINNQINQAQAEQALGFYPKACNTLLGIFSDKDCTTLRDNPQELAKDKKGNSPEFQEENKQKQQREFFNSLVEKSVDSPTKFIALRSLGNVLRGLGELDLSNYVLLLSLQKVQNQEIIPTWLDVGNIRRALSNKEQDLYNRSGDRQHVVCAIVDGYAAIDAYEHAIKKADLKSALQIAIQTRLNRLSFLLDLKDWRQKVNQESKVKNIQESQDKDVFNRVFRLNTQSLINQQKKCWDLLIPDSKIQFDSGILETRRLSPTELYNWLSQNLSEQNPIIQLQEIDNIRQQIEKLPQSHTTLYTRLNFAKNWMRIQNLPEEQYQKIEKFLNETIEEAQGKPDKKLRNLRAESYALGYLGKLYESRKQWNLARTKTQKALLIAQSIPAQEIAYLWQWQLGRIYKPEYTTSEQVKVNEIQNNLKNIKEAREAYKGAFETLQFLRRELATGSPDAQLSFLEEIETVYREYVNLLLSGENPEQTQLSQARIVITSLQAVELENFLRQACPENNLQKIDDVLEKKAKTAAFIYPIVLDDRIEVILKLPEIKELQHFRKKVVSDDVKELVRQLQLNLEEEYTFVAVREEANQLYDWLMKDVDKYIEKNYKSIDTLVFALDTNLRNIPLAALVYEYDKASEQPKYLIDKYAIALAPRLDIPYPDVLQGRKLNILAAGLAEPEPKVNEREERKFSKLRYVEAELNVLDNLENSRVSVTKLANDKFNTKDFQTQIEDFPFQILHLATHGEFSSSPENTFILAHDQVISIKELGDVFRTQLQSQPEPIELLVLSACETAAGDERATLGISGVGVRAGARSSIASLWTLDDEISVDFTKIFYRQLIDPKVTTKAQALRQAQKVLKELRGREHPRYWASYILLGNWL